MFACNQGHQKHFDDTIFFGDDTRYVFDDSIPEFEVQAIHLSILVGSDGLILMRIHPK
jgi:hypothetical protein